VTARRAGHTALVAGTTGVALTATRWIASPNPRHIVMGLTVWASALVAMVGLGTLAQAPDSVYEWVMGG